MDCMKYGQYLEYTSLFADSRDFSVTLPDENCGMNAFDGCLTILNAKIHGSGDTTSAFVREKNYG